jgi:hypothetical protein
MNTIKVSEEIHITQIEKVLYTAKVHTTGRAGGRGPTAQMAAWTLSSRLLAPQAAAPIQSSCSRLVGRPVSKGQWALLPAK